MHRDCVLYMYVASVSRRSFRHSHIAGRVRRTQLPNIQLSISYMFAEVQTSDHYSNEYKRYFYCVLHSTVLPAIQYSINYIFEYNTAQYR